MFIGMNYILSCVFVLLFLNAHSKDRLVILEWQFKGIEEGYNHLNRCKVFVDGKEMPLSDTCLQSNWGFFQLRLSPKEHRIQVVNEAYYSGKWIEHTFENGFSMNAACEFSLNVKEVHRVQIQFDLDNATTSIVQFDLKGKVWLEKPERFKGKHDSLVVSWKFNNIEEGYDHLSRMRVFVDGIEYGTSPESPESVGGEFTISIPRGLHQIRIVNQALIDGNWQDHTIVNDYSVDAVYEKEIEIKKSVRVHLIIDLDNEHTVNQWEY